MDAPWMGLERRQSSFHGGQKGWPAPQILLPDRFSSRAAMEEAALGLAACRVPPPLPPLQSQLGREATTAIVHMGKAPAGWWENF